MFTSDGPISAVCRSGLRRIFLRLLTPLVEHRRGTLQSRAISYAFLIALDESLILGGMVGSRVKTVLDLIE